MVEVESPFKIAEPAQGEAEIQLRFQEYVSNLELKESQLQNSLLKISYFESEI